MGILSKSARKGRNRRQNNMVNRPQPTAAIRITGCSFAGSEATVTFDQAVGLRGVPNYTTDLPATPLSAEQTSPTTVTITYTGTVAAATALNVPYEDPAVRNASGGFVGTSSVGV